METSSEKSQEHCCKVTNSILKNLVPNCFIQLTPINRHIWKHTFCTVTFWIWSSGIPNPMGKVCPSLPSTVTWYISKKCLKEHFEKQKWRQGNSRSVHWEVRIGVTAEDLGKGAREPRVTLVTTGICGKGWNNYSVLQVVWFDMCVYIHTRVQMNEALCVSGGVQTRVASMCVQTHPCTQEMQHMVMALGCPSRSTATLSQGNHAFLAVSTFQSHWKHHRLFWAPSVHDRHW